MWENSICECCEQNEQVIMFLISIQIFCNKKQKTADEPSWGYLRCLRFHNKRFYAILTIILHDNASTVNEWFARPLIFPQLFH
jgi:hypothetical protein